MPEATRPERPLWTRLPDESPAAFRAFEIYRDIIKGRSLRLAYAAYVEDKGNPGDGDEYRNGPKTVPGSYKGWSSKHQWTIRAGAYDAHLRTLAREQNEQQHVDELTEYRGRLLTLARGTTEATAHILGLLNRSLESYVKEATAEGDGAKPIPLERIAPLLRAAAYAGEVSTNAEAVALGVDDLLSQLDARVISARKEEERERSRDRGEGGRAGRDED